MYIDNNNCSGVMKILVTLSFQTIAVIIIIEDKFLKNMYITITNISERLEQIVLT